MPVLGEKMLKSIHLEALSKKPSSCTKLFSPNGIHFTCISAGLLEVITHRSLHTSSVNMSESAGEVQKPSLPDWNSVKHVYTQHRTAFPE